MSYYDNAQDKASLLASKLEGLSYLFFNANIDGERTNATEAHYGIGVILESFAKEARDLDRMLDSGARPAIDSGMILASARAREKAEKAER